MDKVYTIHEDNRHTLIAGIEALNRRARRLGVDEIKLTIGAAHVERFYVLTDRLPDICEVEEGQRVDGVRYTFMRSTDRVVATARLVGRPVRLNGWAFIATLQHEEGGTILRTVPSADVPAGTLDAYRQADPACSHCNLDRRRGDTFVVRHEDGRTAQVGRTCLQDFLGGDPSKIARLAEFLAAADELADELADEPEGSGGGHGPRMMPMVNFIAAVVAVVRADGWLSRGKASEMGRDGAGTADLAWSFATGRPLAGVKAEEGDKAAAETLIAEAVATLDAAETLTDYEHNLRVALMSSVATGRTAGIAASAVPFVNRARLAAAERNAPTSEFLGVEGEKLTATAVVVSLHTVEGDYGPSTFANFRTTAGARIVWKATGSGLEFLAPMSLERSARGALVATDKLKMVELRVGDTVEITGTVKRHEVARKSGHRETWMTRCALVAPDARPILDAWTATEEVRKSAERKAAAKAKREAAKAAKLAGTSAAPATPPPG